LKNNWKLKYLVFVVLTSSLTQAQNISLKTGDLIFTGTPAGVGPIAIGDRLTGYIGTQKMFDFEVK
jgi:2-keto-4-pentenoate hydratase/2-oxohepta-3-ene-1,7-dioic acid hydratase in catechol pathway